MKNLPTTTTNSGSKQRKMSISQEQIAVFQRTVEKLLAYYDSYEHTRFNNRRLSKTYLPPATKESLRHRSDKLMFAHNLNVEEYEQKTQKLREKLPKTHDNKSFDEFVSCADEFINTFDSIVLSKEEYQFYRRYTNEFCAQWYDARCKSDEIRIIDIKYFMPILETWIRAVNVGKKNKNTQSPLASAKTNVSNETTFSLQSDNDRNKSNVNDVQSAHSTNELVAEENDEKYYYYQETKIGAFIERMHQNSEGISCSAHQVLRNAATQQFPKEALCNRNFGNEYHDFLTAMSVYLYHSLSFRDAIIVATIQQPRNMLRYLQEVSVNPHSNPAKKIVSSTTEKMFLDKHYIPDVSHCMYIALLCTHIVIWSLQLHNSGLEHIFSLLGLVSWWLGLGKLAKDCAEHSQNLEPDNNLSRIIVLSMSHNIVPSWLKK